MTQSISWHFRTSPQQSWSTQIIEDTKKQWKAQKILLPGFVQPTNKLRPVGLFDLRRFSSSIKTTNINTEEIFSVHSTFFFPVQKKILLVLVLGRHQHREEEEKQFSSKKWPSEHCFLPFDRQEAKHQLTFPDFTSTILEHPDYWRRRK